MYHSRDVQDHDIAVTGTVFSPLVPWLGFGPRPWVDLAVGTQGLGPQCAPSKQFVAATEQELEPVEALLAHGWGVVVSDYEGYTTGATPTYVAGVSEAHTVLDMARAAGAVPRDPDHLGYALGHDGLFPRWWRVGLGGLPGSLLRPGAQADHRRVRRGPCRRADRR